MPVRRLARSAWAPACLVFLAAFLLLPAAVSSARATTARRHHDAEKAGRPATPPPTPTPKAKAKPSAAPRYYLALGDSLSVGIQPDATTGVIAETPAGYVSDLATQVRSAIPGLRLVDLGCPGETSTSFLTGQGNAGAARFHCRPAGGSQLRAALAFLKAHHRPGEVALITIDIGANDVDSCANLTAGTISLSCVTAGVSAVQRNLATIARRLAAAAPTGTVLAGMNYYDPFLSTELVPATQAIGQASVALADNLNGIIAKDLGAAHFKVADVAAAFQTDSTQTTTLDGQTVPVGVAEICALTWMCAPAPVGPNIHANATGYQTIAQAFQAVIAPL